MRRILSIIALMLFSIVALAQRSEGTATANLSNRTVIGSIPRLTAKGLVDGTVCIDIAVDQYGAVVEAVPNTESSSVTNDSVRNAARSAAMRVHFNTSANASTIQKGTIIYTFISIGKELTDETALKFMGIPIDGSVDNMIEELKDRGFEHGYGDDYLSGIFNGEKVRVHISTNHNVVDRIKVVYPYCSEDNDTRIKYNTLLSRFNRNAKYVSLNPRGEIPADERLFWNIQSNSKFYDVAYFYLLPEIKPEEWKAEFNSEYRKHFSKPIESLSYDELEEVLLCMPMKIRNAISGIVWFTLPNVHYINIYYDNLQNRPRGEDL